MAKNYDEKIQEQILEFARRLENSSISETNKKFETYAGENFTNFIELEEIPYQAKEYRGKGSFGDVLEEKYFGKKNDTLSAPDFPEASIELKASPLKVLKDNTIKVKERLILNLFSYMNMDKEIFEASHFLYKSSKILLVFYFYEKDQDPELMEINLVDIWECMKEDGAQIQADWEAIAEKIHRGEAETISEGDTLFLGACTKGATRESSMQIQPHSDKLAPGRALCFKISYMNSIYKTLLNRKKNRKEKTIHLVTSIKNDLNSIIQSIVSPYLGKTLTWIIQEKGISSNPKAKYAIAARAILGFKAKNETYYEFSAGNIQVKSIRVEINGNIKESMSFKPIRYTEIINQEWEDSDFYQELISKFIFVIFKRLPDDSDYFLSEVKLWNMPEKDLEIVHEVWERARECIRNDDFKNLPKLSDKRISHVRPHAKNKYDVMLTPSNHYEYKRSFWLNREYIKTQIINNNEL